MPAFDEYLTQLREGNQDGIPDTIYDGLRAEYDNIVSVSQAKVDSLLTEKEALELENRSLKSQNYDLIMSRPVDNNEPKSVAEDTLGEENISIRDLFKKGN